MNANYPNVREDAVPVLIELIDEKLKENNAEFNELYAELGIAGVLRHSEFGKLATLLGLNRVKDEAQIEGRLKELKEQCDELIKARDALGKITIR